MMDFPIADLMDERACYDRLVEVLHPDGLACPRCRGTDASIHRYHRDPVLDFRCKGCGAVYNLFSGTDRRKTHFRPSQVVLILRGFAQGRSTAGQARALAAAEAGATPLPDGTVEADEVYQNAGEKRGPAHRPRRPAAAAGQQGAGPRHLGE